MRGARRLAAAGSVAAVSIFWFALYDSLPIYPPGLGLSLAVAAILFLTVLVLLHRMHTHVWPGIGKFGFIVSAIGLGVWIVGGTLNALGQQPADSIARPQVGWVCSVSVSSRSVSPQSETGYPCRCDCCYRLAVSSSSGAVEVLAR